ncbi:S-adenosyl-L-methionine-dependent methyltransferase [Aureobasidium sp. EXF-10728]|nr:S-adenosyl-L-methionine-dependent methyltransferase [Aureobasidium sp. EXF-10728]
MRRPSATTPSQTGSSRQPIMIDDDDDDGIDYISTDPYSAIMIDDDEDETEDDEDVQLIFEHIAVLDDEYRWGAPRAPRPARATKKKPSPSVIFEPRTKPITNVAFLQGHWIVDTFCLVPGLVVELQADPGRPLEFRDAGDFLKIESIYEDLDTHKVYLRGLLYRRTRTLNGMLPKKLNEVYQVLQQNLEDPRAVEVQSLHDVSVDSVVRTRCLKHTNVPFPENSFRTREDMHEQSKEFCRDFAQLTCRWKRLFQYGCSTNLRLGYPEEQSIQRLTDVECDEGFRVPDVMLRRAVPKVKSDLTVVDLTAEEAADQTSRQLADMLNNTHISEPIADSAHTFADFYCGGGGVSIGAREAGFKVVYGVDHDKDACATYRLNFPGTTVFEEDINYHLTVRVQENGHVRVVHMSTVCKTVSTAYTVRGKNHDANEATLFTISDILRKATPMVATLEQTFGALNPGKKQLFNSFVLQFTSMNYSVKWAAHTLSEFGVPQKRKRLIMIASCPGHPLPDFPAPTHSPDETPVPGLKPCVTVHDALAAIRRDAHNHDTTTLTAKDFAPYNPHQLARGCITTSGGQNNWHPSGKRALTGREYACLQTFPLDHVFVGTRSSVIRQVGNAVPPAFSKLLYASIRKTLEEVDKQDRESRRPIIIDEDEEMMDDGRVVVDLT